MDKDHFMMRFSMPLKSRIPSVMSSRTKPALEFFKLLQQLKLKKRTGWIQHNVRNPESIAGERSRIALEDCFADHMYRMSMMAFLLRDSVVNTEKCIKMALVHDIAESIVGDITPNCGISKDEKHRLEMDAMQRIRSMLQNHPAGEKWDLLCEKRSFSGGNDGALGRV